LSAEWNSFLVLPSLSVAFQILLVTTTILYALSCRTLNGKYTALGGWAFSVFPSVLDASHETSGICLHSSTGRLRPQESRRVSCTALVDSYDCESCTVEFATTALFEVRGYCDHGVASGFTQGAAEMFQSRILLQDPVRPGSRTQYELRSHISSWARD
jgi:hypothetical protein